MKRPVPRGPADPDARATTTGKAARAAGRLAAAMVGTAAVSLALHGCAATPATASKYPRRGSGCEIALYHTAVPGAAVWDDLGIAEVACHISSSLSQCLQLLKAEGCRIGGRLDEVLGQRDAALTALAKLPKTADGVPLVPGMRRR